MSSPGKNVKKSRSLKRNKASKENLKKAVAATKKRQVDWVRLEKYKANRLAGMNRYRAAKEAGYAESTARHNSCRFDKLVKIDIQQALENEGATNQIQARELVNLALNATKRQRCTVEVRHDEEGEVVIDDQAAEVVPDLHLRLNAWEQIAKLKNQLKPMPVLPPGDFKRMVLVLEKDVPNDNTDDADRGNQAHPPSRVSVEVPNE